MHNKYLLNTDGLNNKMSGYMIEELMDGWIDNMGLLEWSMKYHKE